ncbi:hypothetical protein DEJ48_35525 [Streptomyces venezuelae]|uniref:Uncharacterized protein n=1 Tax=Streptomyces venezuelae TaxID=54571 RepID=A0A5P2C700_STRVZ|nr:hypothetical protein DEJ48_35525 [Streptomyces venezuelae]
MRRGQQRTHLGRVRGVVEDDQDAPFGEQGAVGGGRVLGAARVRPRRTQRVEETPQDDGGRDGALVAV